MNLLTVSRNTCVCLLKVYSIEGPLVINLFVQVNRFQTGFRLGLGHLENIQIPFLNWKATLSDIVIDVRSRSCPSSSKKVRPTKVLIFGIASILIFFVFYICWPSQEKDSSVKRFRWNHNKSYFLCMIFYLGLILQINFRHLWSNSGEETRKYFYYEDLPKKHEPVLRVPNKRRKRRMKKYSSGGFS